MSRARDPSALAREYGEDAIEVAREIMENSLEESKDRLRAAELILDRGHGKAAQAIIALPAQRQQREAAALYSDSELRTIIDAQFEDVPTAAPAAAPAALAAPKDPLLA